MKLLYLDCAMGAAGDMLTAALLELTDDPAATLDELNAMGLHDVQYRVEKTSRCGITGTSVHVVIHGHEEGEHEHTHDHEHHHDHEHGHHHEHTHLPQIEEMIRACHVPETVKENAMRVYTMLAQAESKVHGTTVEQVHFHEVGALDAVADVLAVCYLIDKLAPERIIASPICVGTGTVHCAHGELSVPAPATAELLRGIPIYGGSIATELCTPTGAALLKTFVGSFGEIPVLRMEKIGVGCGKKELPHADILRAVLAQFDEPEDNVACLSCNLDDMTGEELGFAQERLLEEGALDVFTVPVGMKKGRPGVLLEVLCKPDDREKLVRAIFRCTTTLGIRETLCRRYTLSRTIRERETPHGTVREKASTGYGVTRSKPEYEDLARIAHETDAQWPLREPL